MTVPALIMVAVKRAVEVVAAEAPRVSVVLKADVRADVDDAPTAKVARVEARLAAGPRIPPLR